MNLYGLKQLVESARTVRQNTILIAEDISESDYGYRPTPESRSVAETLVHIAMLSRASRLLHEEASLEDFDFGQLIRKSEIEEKRPRSKNEIVELLRAEGEDWRRWLETLPETQLADHAPLPRRALKRSLARKSTKCITGRSSRSSSGCLASCLT